MRSAYDPARGIVATPYVIQDDTTRTVTAYDETGKVTSTRPYTADENAAADRTVADAATLTDVLARLARIEAHLWPSQPDPTSTESVPTMADYGGIWPADGLLLDGGKVWRNVTTVPLTTAPSGFHGTTSQWDRLFVEVVMAVPEPEPSEWPAWKPWDNQPASLYAKDAKVSHNGRRWIADVGNNHWEPGVYGWTDAGPA